MTYCECDLFTHTFVHGGLTVVNFNILVISYNNNNNNHIITRHSLVRAKGEVFGLLYVCLFVTRHSLV